jgi:hypothetical protein
MYEGRDILDLFTNIANPSPFFTATPLPKNNLDIFITNRSQYHRLSKYGVKDKPLSWVSTVCTT